MTGQLPELRGGKTDVHIHFPAGAVSKDGPSAGVTIVTVLVSLFTGRLVRSDTAMTGEITLRGLVLPVSSIRARYLVHTWRFFFHFLSEIRIRLCECTFTNDLQSQTG